MIGGGDLDLITIFAILSLLLVALIFSPLGLGGGVLYVPILYYMLGWEMQEAVIGSLTLVLMVSLGSSLAHSKAGLADKEASNAGRITAIPSAIIGTILSGLFISLLGDIIIKILATIILIFVIERTIRQMKNKIVESKETPLSEKKTSYLLGNSFAGLSSGILGIGGGAILVTANRSILRMDANKAAGTSYLVVSTIVPVALISHIILDGVTGNLIDRIKLLPIMIFIPHLAFVSSFIGAKYAIKHLSKYTVTIVFLCAVSLSLLRYIIDFIN